jgi:murein DD-endopeptidase MepM/ murein hydrolase activator NlpD
MSKQRRHLTSARQTFLALLTAAAFFGLVTAIAVAATTEEKLEQTKAKINKANEKKGVLTSDIERLSGKIRVLEGEISVLRKREAAVEAQLAAKQAELDSASAELKAAREHLAELRVRLAGSLKELKERLIAIYRTGTPDMTSLILSSTGFDDMMQRAEYMHRIQSQDESIVNRVRDLRDQTKEQVGTLREMRDRIQAARDAIAAKERELARTRASIEGQKASLVSARGDRQAMLDRVEAEVEELEEIEASLQKKLQERIAASSGYSSSGPVGPPSAAGLIWPLNGLFTSPFGFRWGRMHEGIDIAVPEGTAVRAAQSGTVILAAYTGGYGNYICIDHGGGLSTCYAHLSSYAVSSGAKVSQGSVIAGSGNTGSSTGPHLHFEVRVNGAAQDPMAYL